MSIKNVYFLGNNIYTNTESDNISQNQTGESFGTSIAELLKQRQNEQIEQIIIDKYDNTEEVKIEDILEEYKKLD